MGNTVTKRVVVFKSRTGWFLSPEFCGDKAELAQVSQSRTCEKAWEAIRRRFIVAKTLDEFTSVCRQTQSLYHDSMAPRTVPCDIRRYNRMETIPDELLVVNEDLGVTGIHSLGVCPTCGRTYPVYYAPDGKIEAAGYSFNAGNSNNVTNESITCLTCASKLQMQERLPYYGAWHDALEKYRKSAPSFRLAVPDDFPKIRKTLREYNQTRPERATEEELENAAKAWLSDEMRDRNAGTHMGQPVKLLKIVNFQYDEFFFEVLFRDWSTAVVRERYIFPLEKNDAAEIPEESREK